MTTTTIDCDVVVIGAGPAGSAAAAMLAEQGHNVVIVEKSQFPRYKVGESLIPYCWFPLERLGVLDRLRDAPFVVEKRSVQFVGTDGSSTIPFYFSRHTDHDCARTWQVQRPDFDIMLLDNATQHGATCLMDTNARSLRREGGRVIGIEARRGDEAIQINARMTVDASGRDQFTVSREKWRVADPHLRKIAIWSYFTGAIRDCGIDEGATTIAYLPDKGWFWYIPLPDDAVSVGIVAERDYLYRGDRDLATIFDREVADQPWIAERLAPATRAAVFRVTGDYSYRSRHAAEDGLLLAGDAFAFLDPVFSSGVFLALQSGVMAGDAIHEALVNDDVSAGRFTEYADRLCASMESMRRLVFAFYDTGFSFGEFMRAHPDMRHALTDCLIGNLERDYTEMFSAMSSMAAIPEPLDYGRPRSREGDKA